MSISAQIRVDYDTTELSVSEIAKKNNVRYQFAHNVISKHIGDLPIRKAQKVSKSALIRQERAAGLSISQISKKHSITYQYVFNVVKKAEK